METSRTYSQNFQKFCNTSSAWAEQYRNLPEVLGFVAPWSDHGYRAARYFRGKLSIVSPLWFRVLPGTGSAATFELAGWEIAKEQARWTKQAASEFCLGGRCGDGPEVLPHLSFEGFDRLPVLKAVLEAPLALAAEIAVLCERGGYRGIVLDVRLALFPSVKPLLLALVRELGRALHGAWRRLLLSVPAKPPQGSRGPLFNATDAAAVAAHVDGIIVGTRDYSRQVGKEPGPSSPINWAHETVSGLLSGGEGGLRATQVLMEIPLYGRAFQEGTEEGRVIVVSEIAKVLAKQSPKVVWDETFAEHSAKLPKKGVTLSLPSLASVAERLKLASDFGVGIALRDLGSGLDAAFDLLPVRGDMDAGAGEEPSNDKHLDSEGAPTGPDAGEL